MIGDALGFEEVPSADSLSEVVFGAKSRSEDDFLARFKAPFLMSLTRLPLDPKIGDRPDGSVTSPAVVSMPPFSSDIPMSLTLV